MGEDNGEDDRDLSHLTTPQHHGIEVLAVDLSPLQIPECKCWICLGLLRRQGVLVVDETPAVSRRSFSVAAYPVVLFICYGSLNECKNRIE